MITMLKSKIHRARVTGLSLDYEGSITIDKSLMTEADILPYEQVHVLDIDNSARLETYVIEGERGSGVICVNGAAARLVSKGDKVGVSVKDTSTTPTALNNISIVVYLQLGRSEI